MTDHLLATAARVTKLKNMKVLHSFQSDAVKYFIIW